MNDRLVSLLERILSEQKIQTALLATMTEQQLLLIQTLADEGEDPDAEPLTYMDGSRVN